jgi:hypothetical protein
VYDISGREVRNLLRAEYKKRGTYKINFDASELSSGVYIYTLRAGVFSEYRKMVLVK